MTSAPLVLVRSKSCVWNDAETPGNFSSERPAAVALGVYFRPAPRDVPINAGYIIDRNRDIGLGALLKVIGKSDFSDAEINRYFSKGVVNDYTVCFFKSLQWRFRSSTDLDSHYDEVCRYLHSRRPRVRNADALCGILGNFRPSRRTEPRGLRFPAEPHAG